MDADRNLLFGVIAMQAGLISAGQFAEACSVWTSRKEVTLADLLSERSWINETDRSHVEYLLERRLEKHTGDVQASLACLPEAIKRSLTGIRDADIQKSLAGGAADDPGLAETLMLTAPLCASEAGARYALLELHGVGGVGRVWHAQDKTLDRMVALKELKPELANEAVLRARFQREAKITGQLEHPGIVPVYDFVSQSDSGRSFYTMRFVKGRTLAQAARDFHNAREQGQADTTSFVSLLNAFVTVCNTVAYAHSRGVIHRDLKGQNVVLGNFGETVVLDWGFAKQPTDKGLDDELFMQTDPTGVGNSELTMQGEALGTPAYMAPEQAAGRLEFIDRRTDVYGLGSTLYQLLTGEPPFNGSDVYDVLRKVQSEEPIPPEQHWAEVPPTLQAACLRALAKEPSARFASAGELAHEVEQWQEIQRRQAEQALRDSEALYRSLVDMLPLILIRKDLESRFTFANNRFCQSLGRPLEEIVGKTDADFFPAEVAEEYQRNDRQVFETGKTFETEENYVEKGETRDIEVIKTPIYDSRGELCGLQVICWDVTEQKRLEQALRESEAFYEALTESLPQGIIRKDAEGRFTYVNRGACELLGLPREKIIGKTDYDIGPAELAEKYRQDDHEVMKSGKRYEIVEESETIGAPIRSVQTVKTAVYDLQGNPIGIQAIFWDVTQREKLQASLQQKTDEVNRLREELRALRSSSA